MREKQNTYLFTAGIMVFAFLFVPLTRFDKSNDLFTIANFAFYFRLTGYPVYKVFIGSVLNIILAILIFAAVTVYRNKAWQQQLTTTALITNTALLAFIAFKYIGWKINPQLQNDHPIIQFGIVLPFLTEMMLVGTLQQLKKY